MELLENGRASREVEGSEGGEGRGLLSLPLLFSRTNFLVSRLFFSGGESFRDGVVAMEGAAMAKRGE